MGKYTLKVRNEYHTAAKRHLAVCKELKNKIHSDFELRENSLNEKEKELKQQLLSDLYYLTGYIIECSCCMAIYHHFKVFNKRELRAKEGGNKKNNISFSNKVNLDTFLIIGDGNNPHSLEHFKNVFTSNYLNISKSSLDIPLLNGDLSIFKNNNCKTLFEEYEAEIRYNKIENCSIKLDYKNTFGFLESASIIYKKTCIKFNIKNN